MGHSTEQLTSNQISVLYVEDSNVFRTHFSQILRIMFKEVFLASNGEEGFEKFVANNNINLVITDINMPKLNGIEMIKKIKQIKPITQIIVTSAYSNNENLFDCIRATITDFVTKPIKIIEFKDAVRKCIQNIELFANSQSNTETSSSDIDLIEKFKVIMSEGLRLEFVNHYKGVPIKNFGFITDVKDNFIVIQIPIVHGVVADIEKKVIFKNNLLDGDIEASVKEISNHGIKLDNFKIVQKSSTERTNIRVIPDNDFEMNLFTGGQKVATETIDISTKAISFKISKMELKPNSDVDIAIRFTVNAHQRSIERINCKGKLIKLELSNNYIFGVVSLQISKREELILSKYIYYRSINLLGELKKLQKPI